MTKKKEPHAKAAKPRKRVAKHKRRATKKPEFIGRLRGVIRIVGDIEPPVVPPEDWEYD